MGVVIYDLPDDNDISYYYFPDYQNGTRIFWTSIIDWFGANFFFGLPFRAWLSISALILLFIHILILSRKSLRTSSINVIMIGLAITDITFMLFNIFRHFGFIIDGNFDSCTPVVHLYSLYFFMGFSALADFSRRASSWLVVFMALIRAVVIKKGTNPKFKKLQISSSGWISVLVAMFMATPITTVEWFRYQFNYVSEEDYLIDCLPEDRVNNYTFPVFNMSASGFFEAYSALPLKIYYFSEAITSKFLPCFISPILTAILINEINASRRKKSTWRSKNYRERDNRTTKLVSFMSISFLIIHLPQGLMYTSQIFFVEQLGVTLLMSYFMSFFTTLYILNAASHLVLCFYLSNQYRAVVLYIIRLPFAISIQVPTIQVKNSVGAISTIGNFSQFRTRTPSQVNIGI
ncbi:unnamed protein product [Caenorhabditis angaria]|uniref:G-protein coupled receptors family 1 profile domain-containing protein n=1 Tax=Caenorhabditis angaria TaxID=860376 RepID=A0A9P1N8L9_9PELO|nr:unnamed protein product [Caenorhabditis angaria]